MSSRRLAVLVLCAFDPQSTFSYHTAWPKHIASHPRFSATVINLQDRSAWARARALVLLNTARFDAVVLLHSVFSNAQLLDGVLLEFVQRCSQPKVFFIGNEYKLMPEKMSFAQSMPVALLVSQSSSQAVQDLYRRRLACPVCSIPNTGLDETLFVAHTRRVDRPIDLGYRADDAPAYIGHQERRQIGEFFRAAAHRYGLVADISMKPEDRFTEPQWAAFLDRCKAVLGAEAGGDYFELDDRTRSAVIAYEATNQGAPFAEIFERFFAGYGPSVPIRIISGRQVEAAGTRTTQILFEGRFDGYFEPDVHYIPLKKDFSNADEVVRKFRDAAFCEELTTRAHQVATEQLTYRVLLDRFANEMASVI